MAVRDQNLQIQLDSATTRALAACAHRAPCLHIILADRCSVVAREPGLVCVYIAEVVVVEDSEHDG